MPRPKTAIPLPEKVHHRRGSRQRYAESTPDVKGLLDTCCRGPIVHKVAEAGTNVSDNLYGAKSEPGDRGVSRFRFIETYPYINKFLNAMLAINTSAVIARYASITYALVAMQIPIVPKRMMP